MPPTRGASRADDIYPISGFLQLLVQRFRKLDFRQRNLKNLLRTVERKRNSTDERDRLVERLLEFLRFGYMTGSEVVRQIGVHDTAVYSWLTGEFKPSNPKPVTDFLDSLPTENGSGIMLTGYEYRECKNWRGIPKPRRCPFCKSAKGEIRKVRGGYQGVCPKCGASGPKREGYDEALRAWNGRE